MQHQWVIRGTVNTISLILIELKDDIENIEIYFGRITDEDILLRNEGYLDLWFSSEAFIKLNKSIQVILKNLDCQYTWAVKHSLLI